MPQVFGKGKLGDRYKMLFSWVFLVKSNNNLICYEKKKVETLGASTLFCYICTTFLNDNKPRSKKY